MHMKAGTGAPAKQKDTSGDVPCCKILRAVTTAKIAAEGNTLDFVLKEYLSGITLRQVSQPSSPLLLSDTGPPGALSFSESVLQRSILAHAPPIFLS